MLKPKIEWLFVFLPVTFLLEHLESVSPPVLFFAAAISIVPVAHLLVQATEHLSERVGEAFGGLLNATFGNAPELIIALVALRAGYLEMVRASIIGAILANLLFSQGLAYLFGGMKYHDQNYNSTATRVYSTMMMIAVCSLAVPSAFGNVLAGVDGEARVLALNVRLSVLLLVTYALYLFFMLKTHPNYFVSEGAVNEGKEAHNIWSVPRAVSTLIAASVLAAFMSEILVGAAEGTGKALGMSEVFMGLVVLSIVGGAAECASAVATARRNRMDLSVGIAIGSSIQIALFVAPVLVLASYVIAPEPLTLVFNGVSVGFLALSVIIGAMVTSDGRANWYKGVQLLVVYLMIAIMVYDMPAR